LLGAIQIIRGTVSPNVTRGKVSQSVRWHVFETYFLFWPTFYEGKKAIFCISHDTGGGGPLWHMGRGSKIGQKGSRIIWMAPYANGYEIFQIESKVIYVAIELWRMWKTWQKNIVLNFQTFFFLEKNDLYMLNW
jgi:hypothetical protein